MASNCEAYFKHSLKMALENNFSWTTLASMLDEMTPTLSKTKQLVKVLLQELQKLQKENQGIVQNKCQPSNKIDLQNDDLEIQEEEIIIENVPKVLHETVGDKEGNGSKEFSEDETGIENAIEREGISNDEPEIIEEI